MIIAGLGWLCVLCPPVKNYLSVYIMIIGFAAELSLMICLILKSTKNTN